MPRDASIRSLRVFRGLKLACDAGKRNRRRAAEWSFKNDGRAAFGESLTDEGIKAALEEIEAALNLPEGTLFARGKAAKGQVTLHANDETTQQKLAWAEKVIAAYEEREKVEYFRLVISSENYISVAILPYVIKAFNALRKKANKHPVSIVVHELASLRAAKEDHERSASDFILHSVRAAVKGKRQSWTKEEGLVLLKRKIDDIKSETAIELPDVAFIPRTKRFERLWQTSDVLEHKSYLDRDKLSLSELGPYPVALVGHVDDAYEVAIPGGDSSRVVVGSLAAAVRLVETEDYVGVMNCFGVRLLRNAGKVVVRTVKTDRPPIYLQVYHGENVTLSAIAREFIDAVYRWLFVNSPGPKPKGKEPLQ